jgi:hypothetical protein
MDACIQIGPGVLFAAIVLSPEWAWTYQQADALAPRDQGMRAASGVAAGDVARQPRRDTAGQSGEQMALL